MVVVVIVIVFVSLSLFILQSVLWFKFSSFFYSLLFLLYFFSLSLFFSLLSPLKPYKSSLPYLLFLFYLSPLPLPPLISFSPPFSFLTPSLFSHLSVPLFALPLSSLHITFYNQVPALLLPFLLLRPRL